MTISYTHNIIKAIFIWKGSLWEIVWKDLMVFMVAYISTNLTIRFALTVEQQAKFMEIREVISKELRNYNLIFILGFFLSHIFDRWWRQFELVASNPSTFAMSVSTLVRAGKSMDEKTAEKKRLSMMRWVVSMTVLSWRRHASRIKKRFPTVEHLEKAGLLTKEETEMILETKKTAPYGNWWQPCLWIHNAIHELQEEGSMSGSQADGLRLVIDEYRSKLDSAMNFHWVPVPLPYTQLVTCATLFYFVIEVLSHQLMPTDQIDYYVPVFFIIKFILFVGTLRVSEEMMDPFGEDGDDFDTNWLLDWSTNTCFLQMGPLHGQMPKYDDNGFSQKIVINLPHTIASSKIDSNGYISLVEKHLKIKDEDKVIKTESEVNVVVRPSKCRGSRVGYINHIPNN